MLTYRSRRHETAQSGELFSHNIQSLEKLVGEVAEKTGVGLSIEVSVVDSAAGQKAQDHGDWLYLRYSIMRT